MSTTTISKLLATIWNCVVRLNKKIKMRHKHAVFLVKVKVQSQPKPVVDMCSLFYCILYATIAYSTFQQDLLAAFEMPKCNTIPVVFFFTNFLAFSNFT